MGRSKEATTQNGSRSLRDVLTSFPTCSVAVAVKAAIGLDMLGDRDLAISVPANGSPALTKIAVYAARRAGYPDLVKPMREFVTDDHAPFVDKGYRAIDLIDFSYGPDNSYWHTDKDVMANVSKESLLKSGRILVEMLNILL